MISQAGVETTTMMIATEIVAAVQLHSAGEAKTILITADAMMTMTTMTEALGAEVEAEAETAAETVAEIEMTDALVIDLGAATMMMTIVTTTTDVIEGTEIGTMIETVDVAAVHLRRRSRLVIMISARGLRRERSITGLLRRLWRH